MPDDEDDMLEALGLMGLIGVIVVGALPLIFLLALHMWRGL